MMSSVNPAATFEGASPSGSFADIFASPLAQWMVVGADPISIHALCTNLGINDNCGEFIALWSLAGERGAAALDHWYGTFVEPFLKAAGSEYMGPPPQGRILHLAHLWKRALRGGAEEAAKRPFLEAVSSPERFARAYNPAAPPRDAAGGAGGAGGGGNGGAKPTTYSCPACTMRNAMTNAKCDVCETANPDYKGAAGDPVYTGPFAGPAVLEAPALASIGISFQPGGQNRQNKMPLPPGMVADSGKVFGARGAVPWAAITDCGIEEVLPRSL